MRVIQPLVLVDYFDREQILKSIERKGRVCYKSEDRITEESASKFVKDIIRRGHESVIEHEKLSVGFTVDRGVSHEIVRHRIASYSQESTRYCNYSGGKFDKEITVIEPLFFQDDFVKYQRWYQAVSTTEDYYMYLIEAGARPEEARSVLPNSLKTEVEMTANFREWRHFFKVRAQKTAHPQMQQVAIPLLDFLQKKLPEVFGDIGYNEDFPMTNWAGVGQRM